MTETLKPDRHSVIKANDLHDGFHSDAVRRLAEALHTSDVAYQQAGLGLLLAGVKMLPDAALSDRFFNSETNDYKVLLSGVTEHAVKIANFKSTDNSIRMSEMTPRFLPGCAPLFWLPLDVEFLRAVYFHGIVLISIYNPAHIIERFRELGFTVAESKNGRSYRIQKRVEPDRRLVLENSDWFFNAVQMHLMKEEKVFEIVLTIIDELQKQDMPPNTKVQTEIHTRLF